MGKPDILIGKSNPSVMSLNGKTKGNHSYRLRGHIYFPALLSLFNYPGCFFFSSSPSRSDFKVNVYAQEF